MKPSGIVSFYNVPDDAGDPDVKVYVNNELVETGGGGESDFTTCEVTFTNTAASYVYIPELVDTEPAALATFGEKAAGVYTIALYKGMAVIKTGAIVDDTSGLIQEDDENTGRYIITGDCSITFAGGIDN